jgi:NADPH2:quinone reductase
MQAIILTKNGDVSCLKIKKVDDPKAKKNEVVIRQTAIGVNFFDIAHRSGQYKLKEMPAIIGSEAAGVVESVGSEVVDFKVGDRVAYATTPIGAYVEKRAVDQKFLIPIPDYITDEQAAACLKKGLLAHALLHRVYISVRAKRILVLSAAGGVGHILCQWAKYLGLEVIGAVGSDEKISSALSFGCIHAFNYRKNNIVDEVAKITNSEGVGLVYESVGKDTIEKSIACLWPMGMCISFGESSGKCEKIDLDLLTANSLYLSRPTMALYKANRIELVISANEVFEAIKQGIIKPKIEVFDFSEVKKAHQKIESRNSVGSLILKV